ncbi:hypothetical protein BHE74_00042256 [Ensete ventricosum]|nr:hypothetical protein BHE74_00042256 [Ensete ventricosum]
MTGPDDVEDEQQQIGAFARFLISHHAPLLRSIVLSPDPNLHYPLLVDFAELLDFDPPLAHLLFSRPTCLLPLFDEAARRCQAFLPDLFSASMQCVKRENSQEKKMDVLMVLKWCFGGWFRSETFPSIGRIRVKHRGILLTLKGTVIRSGAIKMIEWEQLYECRRCKHRQGNFNSHI